MGFFFIFYLFVFQNRMVPEYVCDMRINKPSVIASIIYFRHTVSDASATLTLGNWQFFICWMHSTVDMDMDMDMDSNIGSLVWLAWTLQGNVLYENRGRENKRERQSGREKTQIRRKTPKEIILIARTILWEIVCNRIYYLFALRQSCVKKLSICCSPNTNTHTI